MRLAPGIVHVAALPEGVKADTPMLVLLKTGVREKRAYRLGSDIKLYWFDDWAHTNPFVPCSILTNDEIERLRTWRPTSWFRRLLHRLQGTR